MQKKKKHAIPTFFGFTIILKHIQVSFRGPASIILYYLRLLQLGSDTYLEDSTTFMDQLSND